MKKRSEAAAEAAAQAAEAAAQAAAPALVVADSPASRKRQRRGRTDRGQTGEHVARILRPTFSSLHLYFPTGIWDFFRTHRCNRVCKLLHLNKTRQAAARAAIQDLGSDSDSNDEDDEENRLASVKILKKASPVVIEGNANTLNGVYKPTDHIINDRTVYHCLPLGLALCFSFLDQASIGPLGHWIICRGEKTSEPGPAIAKTVEASDVRDPTLTKKWQWLGGTEWRKTSLRVSKDFSSVRLLPYDPSFDR